MRMTSKFGFPFVFFQSSTIAELFEESRTAVSSAFAVLCCVEGFVICSAMCLAREITGMAVLVGLFCLYS
jgi:hypothetical protein